MDSPPLLVLTRPRGRNAALARRLAAAGERTRILPLLRVTPLAVEPRAWPDESSLDLVVFVSRVTFDPHNAWVRMAIWDYGSAEMWRHPLFGIGLNDWARPSWLTSSVDNCWLVSGMRHGAVGLGLLLLALATGLWAVARAKLADPGEQRLRRAYLITMVALGFTLTTVHVWGGTSCFVFLLFGAGQWFCDRPQAAPEVGAAPPKPQEPLPREQKGASPYSRFAPRPGRGD